MSRGITFDYIRGFADADGTILKIGYAVYLYNTEKPLLEKISVFLIAQGITNNIREVYRKKPPPNSKTAFVLEIIGMKNLVKYYEKIGFSMDRKHQILTKRVNIAKDKLKRLEMKNYDFLYDLYWTKNMSSYEIQEKTGVNNKTICKWMNDLGVPRRTMSEANNNSVSTGRWKGRWK